MVRRALSRCRRNYRRLCLLVLALGSGGIARVGLLQFLQPVSGVVLAWILLDENLTPVFMLASGIILSGVWLALRGK
jgi:drug/metabolite transporter (DMT)-like permease